MKKNYLLAGIIGGAFIALMTLFALGLNNNPNELDLVTKGRKIPEFSLPSLTDTDDNTDNRTMISNTELTSDKGYYLLNFWGSWCPSCYQEHPYLMKLAKTETIYGVNWKDERKDGLGFIKKLGNPYQKIITDNDSELAIGLGVYGAPETYLIKSDGTIIYRYAGAMSDGVWQKEFLPKIKALK